MTEIQDGERIFGELIYQAEECGFITEEEAYAMNEDLQDLVNRLEEAYK